jgi:type II secretory pathway pseudopilin PulG
MEERRMPPASRPAEAGLSLVDAVAGIALMVVLITGAMTGLASHQSQRGVHSERILAMSACRNTIETLRSVAIGDLPSYDGQGFDVPGQGRQPRGPIPVDGDADGLPGEVLVQQFLPVPPAVPVGGAVLYLVTARVRWQGSSRNALLAMSALVGERR